MSDTPFLNKANLNNNQHLACKQAAVHEFIFQKKKEKDKWIQKAWVPDDSVPLSVSNVDVICEQDGVVGHHRVASRQDASCHLAYAVQDAIIYQEVIHQQLDSRRNMHH